MLEAIAQGIEVDSGNAHGSAPWGSHLPLNAADQGAGQGRLEPVAVRIPNEATGCGDAITVAHDEGFDIHTASQSHTRRRAPARSPVRLGLALQQPRPQGGT